MLQLSQHLAEETFELKDFRVLRNTILCSISRYEEFAIAAEAIIALKDYSVTASLSVSHNTMYLADSEGIIHIYEVENEVAVP